MTAAVGLTAAGSVAALTTEGRAQSMALGAAGLGTGQLALALIANQASKPSKDKSRVAAASKQLAGKRNNEFAHSIEDAFRMARDELSIDEEAAAFSDDYDEEDFA